MGESKIGALGANCVHLCVDMQRMFAEPTDWYAPWMKSVAPAIEQLVAKHGEQTIFTRFITPDHPDTVSGAWRDYYLHWESMTRKRLAPGMLELVPSLARYVPPATVLDKFIYSPWSGTDLHRRLRAVSVDTLVVTGGETEVCVLATVLGAMDLGYKVILPVDAVCSSADDTHDAMLKVYESRFGVQLTTCMTQDVLDAWAE